MRFIFLFPLLLTSCQQNNHKEIVHSSQEDVVHSDSVTLKQTPESVKNLEESIVVEVQNPVMEEEVEKAKELEKARQPMEVSKAIAKAYPVSIGRLNGWLINKRCTTR